MTEAEILALSQNQNEAGVASEISSEGSSGSSIDSDSDSASEMAQISAEAGTMVTGLDENGVLELAQVGSPNAAVKLTPQVHV